MLNEEVNRHAENAQKVDTVATAQQHAMVDLFGLTESIIMSACQSLKVTNKCMTEI